MIKAEFGVNGLHHVGPNGSHPELPSDSGKVVIWGKNKGWEGSEAKSQCRRV